MFWNLIIIFNRFEVSVTCLAICRLLSVYLKGHVFLDLMVTLGLFKVRVACIEIV